VSHRTIDEALAANVLTLSEEKALDEVLLKLAEGSRLDRGPNGLATRLLQIALHLTSPGFPFEEGVQDTPKRFLKYLVEFFQPFDPKEIIKDGFEHITDEGIHGVVVQSNIPFRMACEHHLLPATGRAAVGYLPGDRVIGLSKITRLVQAFGTERPSLQEVIGEKIANAFMHHVQAKGAMVVINAEHGCMACRGVNKPGVVTTTSVVKGVFRDVPAIRAEFFELVRLAQEAK
jgi:GTP cyclohydrolase I